MSPVFTFDGVDLVNLATGDRTPADPVSYDWSDNLLPWEQGGPIAWAADLPQGVPVVPIQTTGGDFYTRLKATCAAAPGRIIVELPAGVHSLTSFRMIGGGGDPTYAFGFWDPKLAGFFSESGAGDCIIEMAPNSTSQAQLDHMSTMQQAAFAPLQMGLIRIDTVYQGAGVPIYLGGVTFEAGPQQPLTSVASDVVGGLGTVYVPQSAPHQGVVVYTSGPTHADSVVSHVRFRGAGKAITSQPPFELGNFSSQRNHITPKFVESDGRMSPRYDATQPRKCQPMMFNGGIYMSLEDSWLHHSNVSRYAANDESVASGVAHSVNYRVVRTKIEKITDTQNRQPPINGGNSLGGYTNASLFGFESSNALIELTDVIASVDNDQSVGQVPTHIQLTNTGPSRKGGLVRVVGGVWRHSKFAQLDGYVTMRIQRSADWWADGFDNTLDIRPNGVRLIPHEYTGAWPPTAGYLANYPKETHFIINGVGTAGN